MRYIYVLGILIFFASLSFSQKEFIRNEGQLIDFNKEIQKDVLYYSSQGGYSVYFRKDGITYIYKKNDFKFKEGDKEKYLYNQHAREEDYREQYANDSTYYYRVDMNFTNSNSQVQLISKEKLKEFNNYYYPHCPDGILNVELSKKITYKNIYSNIDIDFYYKEGNLKYDIILNPGANLKDLEFQFEGLSDLKIQKNKLIIKTPIGDIIENLPRSFVVEGESKEKDVEVNYALKGNKVTFDIAYDNTKKLVIDPQVIWQTLYQESFGIGQSNGIDSKGNQLVNVGYTFSSTNYPLLNPGGGAYYQNTYGGGGDLRLVQFDTNGVRQWSTYYGGSDYEHTPDVVIDYLGRILVCLQTESTDIPTDNAGGYFDATWTAGTYNWASTFILRFNSSGVRDWATHYDHFQYPQIEVDNNNNVILVGQSQYDNPPVQSLGGAYNQATVSMNAAASSSSGDYFIAKFNSSTNRVWATNLGGTCREQMGKIVVDGNNNFYIWGAGDNYYGNGFITQSGGGYFDNALGTGTGGSASDRGDCLIYKFSPTGALLWGTAFGGSDFEWAWTAQAGLTVDANNNLYVVCNTRSTDIPVLNMGGGAYYDATFSNPIATGNPYNHFLARFNSSTQLQWCTYWGDQSYSHATFHGVELGFNNDGELTVVLGVGNGNYYPTVTKLGSYNQVYNSGDVHIAQFDANFAVEWGTYYGGNSGERLGDMVFVENSNSFFMNTSWDAGSGALWVTPPVGAYYDGTVVSSPQLFSKFSAAVCDTTTNTTSTASICETATKALVGSPSGGTWSVVSGGGSISGTTYTPGGGFIGTSKTVTVRYKLSGGGACPADSTDVSFTVYQNPGTANNTTTTSAICETSTKTLAGTPSGGTWSVVSGGGSISGTTYTPGGGFIGSSKTVTIRYTITANGSCAGSTDDVVFTVYQNPGTAVNSTSNADICGGQTKNLVGIPSGGTWSIVSIMAGGTISGNVFTANNVTMSTGVTIRYTIAANGSCPSSFADVTFNVEPVINPSATASGGSLCENLTRTLSAVPSGGAWLVLSGPGTVSGGILTPTGIGTVSLEYSTSGSCGTGADTVDIVINPLPIVDAGLDENICTGDTVNLTATGGGTYQWVLGPATAINQVFPIITTGYRVDVTSDSGCIASDSVTVFVQTSGTATAQNDQAIVVTGIQEVIDIYTNDVGGINSLQILNGPSNGTGSISSGNATYTSTAGYIGNDTIEYEICDANCQTVCDTGFLYITVESDLTIPIGVSPNNDGKNDVFNILGLSRYPNNNLKIFNRWGSLVFEAEPYLNDWAGKSNNGEVIKGTYFYVLKLGEELPSYNGYIELKK